MWSWFFLRFPIPSVILPSLLETFQVHQFQQSKYLRWSLIDFRVRLTPEEGRRTYRPKHCGHNNQDEDSSPKTLLIKCINFNWYHCHPHFSFFVLYQAPNICLWVFFYFHFDVRYFHFSCLSPLSLFFWLGLGDQFAIPLRLINFCFIIIDSYGILLCCYAIIFSFPLKSWTSLFVCNLTSFSLDISIQSFFLDFRYLAFVSIAVICLSLFFF